MKSIFILLLSSICFLSNGHSQESTNLLVMSKTNGFRHKSINAGIPALWKMAKQNNWTVTFTEDSTYFSYENLKNHQAVIFLNTTKDIIGEEGQEAFEKYMNNGGGYVGIHAAADTEYKWDFYKKMLGAQFASHPKTQEATMVVNKDDAHPAIAHLENEWTKVDEWYNFKEAVPSYVHVLLEMDEDSYTGKKMGIEHPISWYHTYEGGRVFYTGLGHTPTTFENKTFLVHLREGIKWAAGITDVSAPKEWTNLLDSDLSKWEKYLAEPHPSVNWEGVELSREIVSGEPIGLDYDPLNVFSVNEDGILEVSGEIYGGLTTKREYSNYHLKLEYKWGQKKWEPRLDRKRDSGLLYHCTGAHGALWNIWMRCLEVQIQEGDTGDLFALGGTNAMTFTRDTTDKKAYHFSETGIAKGVGDYHGNNRNIRSEMHEKPNDSWNTVELMCIGGRSVHIVNGQIVNVVSDTYLMLDGEKKPVTSGKIQLQSEGASIQYKNIQIKELKAFPEEVKKLLEN